MSKVKNTKEQNWGLKEERSRKNKRQYRLHIMIQNQTWYIVHWTNLVHGFFSKVQVHLGQSFVFFVFQSSELFTFFSQFQIIFRGRSIIKFQFCHCPGRCRCLSRCRSWSCRCRHLVASSLAACSSSLPKSSFSVHAASRSPLGCSCLMSSSVVLYVWPCCMCWMLGPWTYTCVHSVSIDLQVQFQFQGFSIPFSTWPCCMSSMLGPWMTVACRSTQLRHIISASSAMLIRGLLVIVDRGQAMLHAADARAVDNSCPLSCCAVICASSAMLTRSRVHCSPFMLLSSIVLVVVIILSHCRVPVLHITISAMQSRSRTIMPMSILHTVVVVVHSLWLRHSRTRNIVSLYVAQLIGHSFSSSLSVILIRSLAKSSSEVSRLHCLCLSLFSPLLRSSSISSSSSSMVVWTLGCLNPRRHFYVCVSGLHCTERDESLRLAWFVSGWQVGLYSTVT